MGAFVVDFYCASESLIVEVDGAIHAQQQEADALRQELLESLGLRVLRLTNDEVEQDLESALMKIRAMFWEDSISPPP
jgi:very-short-patch-repair endonuclease